MKRHMTGKPRNRLQKVCYERFQKGRAIYRKLENKTPTALGRRFNVTPAVIVSVGTGAGTNQLTESEKAMVRLLYAEYKELKAEYDQHTCGAIAADLGMARKTVYEYGIGNFGLGMKPRAPEVSSETMLQPEAIHQFMTMRLSRNPGSCVGYY